MGFYLLLALIAAAAGAMVLLVETAEAQTNPPSSGNWDIYDTTTIQNQRITLSGSLRIYSGGHLTLSDVDLLFNSPSDGGYTLDVRSNGKLTFNGGSIKSSGSTYGYKFLVGSGSTVAMDGVTVSGMYQNRGSNPTDVEGGMVIRSNSVTVEECTFSRNDRVAVTVINARPTFDGCVFEESSYYTYSVSSSYLYRDSYGILVRGGKPTVEGCTFRSIGDYGTLFDDAPSSTYYYVYMRLRTSGVYVASGSADVKDSLFTNIGQMPPSYSMYVYVEKVGRYVRFYFYNEEYRAAVYGQDADDLRVTGCNFSYNYQGYYSYTRYSYGVGLAAGKAVVKECIFLNNNGGGVYARGGNMLFEDSAMYDFAHYGVYVTSGADLSIRNVTINGTAETRQVRSEYGFYVTSSSGILDIREVNITFARYGFYVQSTALLKVHDSVIMNTTTKIYCYGATINCYNVTVQRTDIQLGYQESEVNIYWNLDVLVTWQNGLAIPYAVVQIFNESKGLLKANQAGLDGRMPTITLLQTKLRGTQTSYTSIVNSPLLISAYANATESELYSVQFMSNTYFVCVLEDKLPPNVEVYYPSSNHAQNTTTLELYGIAVDVGSGLFGVEVSLDGETWTRARGALTWNLTLELEEGVYDIHVRGVDVGGGSRLLVIKNVTIDLTAPYLKITQPESNFIYTNQTNIQLTGNAEIRSRVFINGEELEFEGGQFYTQLTDQSEGLNTFEVMAVDLVGNRNITMLYIYQDVTAPILLVEHPPEDYVTNDRVLEISGLTELDVEVTINGQEVDVENGLFTLSMTLVEGINEISIQAVDLARNHKRLDYQVLYDVTPPRIMMEYPTRDEAVNHSGVVVSGAVDSDVEEVYINRVPVPVSNGRFQKDFKLDEGENDISLEVTDWAGNVVHRSYVLTLDTAPPELSLDSPGDWTYATGTTVLVAGRVEVGAILTVDDVEVPNVGGYVRYDAPLVETPPGGEPNLLRVVATDSVGNEATVELHVYRDTSAPELYVYDVNNRTDLEFINITGSVGDLVDLDELSINGMPVQPKSTGYFSAYMPLEMGENTFEVRAVDAAGNEEVRTVTVERSPLRVSDSGILSLGDDSWILLPMFLFLGVFVALATLYVLDRRREVTS